MLVRALFLATSWGVISLTALLLGGKRLRITDSFSSAGWLLIVLLGGDIWAMLTFGRLPEILALTGVAVALGLFCMRWLRDWHTLGQVAWAMTLFATALFMVYTFAVVISWPFSPLSFLAAMTLFFIEMLASLLALTHAYENLDVTCRVHWRNRVDRIEPIAGYTPKVSMHVPAYDEPPEVVAATLRALAALEYPDYEVLVIDNNTPTEQTWRPIEALCRELGPRFRFLHLGHWPGYKSGALNFALAQTAPDAELIAAIDADYLVAPDFLRETVAAFANPKVAFIQTPQDYRDYAGDTYFEALYYGYKYFFEVPMPVRNEHNAAIFGGTMGLIRKSVLQEIGGWDEWCITEDAEASLRILKQGYKGYFYNKSFGRGLMPFSFEGYKKQRFRWCFGGIQILKKHWEALMPWARLVDPTNHLTIAQRYFYLVGGLHWFTDLFNLWFTCLLVLMGVFSLLSVDVTIRPLTGPLLALLAIFWALNLGRFIWVVRQVLGLSWSRALLAMYALFSAGWVTAMACFQSLIQPRGVFLRTPKTKDDSQVWQALRMTRWETALGVSGLVMALASIIANTGPTTLLLAVLLTWQASLYLSATIFSLLSVGASPGLPNWIMMIGQRLKAKGRSVRP
jgi:cellulose synthase/poly-beta-1,6-N-acetylglucosamine synthase-like glycosyltransferase